MMFICGKNPMNIYNQNQSKWLSSEEVCHLLMISKRTLQSYRNHGNLPFAQIGRKIYYKASDIDDYLAAHYIKATFQKGGTE
jgi:excisionase family DNA binding protein